MWTHFTKVALCKISLCQTRWHLHNQTKQIKTDFLAIWNILWLQMVRIWCIFGELVGLLAALSVAFTGHFSYQIVENLTTRLTSVFSLFTLIPIYKSHSELTQISYSGLDTIGLCLLSIPFPLLKGTTFICSQMTAEEERKRGKKWGCCSQTGEPALWM